MSSRTSGDGEAKLNQNDPPDSDAEVPPPASAEANDTPHDQEVKSSTMASEGNPEKLADPSDTVTAPEPVKEKTSDTTDTDVTKQIEPTSDTVVPDQDEATPEDTVHDSPAPTGEQEERSLRAGEDVEVPASTEGHSADDEGKDSVSAASTEELKKASGDSEAPPSTSPQLSGGDGGEGEGGSSMAEGPQTGTQASSGSRGGQDQRLDTGTKSGVGETAAVPTGDHQPSGEVGAGGEPAEVKETAGEETVQGSEEGRGAEGDPQHSSGDDKTSEPSLGKVDVEGEEREMDGKEQAPGNTKAGETDRLEEAKDTTGAQASPQKGEEGESKGPDEQGEVKATPVAEPSGESVERGAPQAADTGPVGETGGGGGDQEGPTGAGKEDSSGGEVVKEDVVELPDDFFYDYDSLVSKAETVDVLPNLLSLHHSFGYECHKRSNLIALDKDVVAFAAGNFVQVVNMATKEYTYIRSLSGGGIGALAVHPSHQYFAVGEKGTKPNIAIYSYPDLKLYRLLREGTEESYSHMDFKPNGGNLLASVGGSPDYMLTVWEWKKESVVLRSKAFSQDIYRVSFSPEMEGQLTTSGTGHIRFWKMANTFTGLKLQGQLGKFGRTELSDIEAYVELPDGKVISGTEWGNFLLWDGGFIKVEIAKKGKKSCHHGVVEALYLEEGELITAGADGFVKVWDYETIDNADITEDSSVFEMDPITEIRVGSGVSIKSLVRSTDPETPTLWYAQDANGAIWKVDVIVSHTRRSPERMMQFPSGAIMGMGMSAKERLVGVISEDGGVAVYNYETREDVCRSKFTGSGSSLIWAPQQVDADSRTILAGFGDGVVRVLVMEESDPSQVSAGKRLAPTLTLAHVCKPHSSAVVELAVDPRGELLATGSKDSTVFFLSIKEGYDPIGFIQTPAPVTSLMWSQNDSADEQKLLVCCEEGSMLEVDAPKKDMFDTSKTYYLDPLKFTCTKFQTVKDKIKKAEEDARKAAERAKKQRAREERLLKKREEEGSDAELSEEEEEEEEEGEEAAESQEEEGKPKGPGPLLKGFYYGPGREFWLSMGGYDAGFLYQYSMVDMEPGQPVESCDPKESVPLPTIAGRDMPLTALTFSHSGSYMLVGAENGNVRVFPLRESATIPGHYDIGNFHSLWTLSIHDNQYGHVTHICCSPDDKYILTAGRDGNVFVFQASLEAGLRKEEAEHLGDVKSVLDLNREVKDIEDPNAYSIEDAKQKAELDRRLKAAEAKKQSVRHEILGLRKQFQRLVNKARQLPEHLQLSKEEFIMDPDMEGTLQQQLQEKVDLLHKEMAWEAEKCSLLRKKLYDRFKAVVDTDHFVLKTFDHRFSVSSYRTPVPSDTYLQMLQEYHTMVASSRATTAETTATRPTTSAVEQLQGEGELPGQGDIPGVYKAKTARMSKAMEKAEAKRIRRIARQKQWSDLMATRPDEKSDDPQDLATYRHAERTIGDYKLKSGSDYVVPEDQRVTATQKRHQLLVLRNEILTRKDAFNSQLLSLRERKKNLIVQIEDLTEKLERVQAKIPPALRKPVPPVPTLDIEELPEQTLEYTKESLLELKAQLAAREEAERKAKVGGDDFGGFGGFGGGGAQPPEGEKKEAAEPPEEEGKEEPVVGEGQEGGKGEEEVDVPVSAEGSVASLEEDSTQQLGSVERQLTEERNIRYLCEATHLLDKIAQLKKEFDNDLCWLRHHKMSLDIQMKMADLRHISLFEELELLKEFEKRESTYTNRYTTKKQEKREMEAKISHSKQLVQAKEKEVARLQGEEKALESSFLEKLEENKFKEFLIKVFKKKIKRVKKKEVKEGDSDNEDSDEDDSDSDWSSSEEEGEEGEGALDGATCPPGCEETLYSLACELREKRLDLEDALAEEKKQLEITKKELESLKKKAKVMEAGVKTAHNELQAFQFEKQQKLNELDQVVVLKLSQVLHFGRGATPPPNLKPCLVFLATERQRLQRRISELHVEKQQETKHFAELKQKHVKLARDKKMMVAKVQELQAAADHAMMLKFGRIVDLDRLEGIHINKTAEDLRMKIEAVERRRTQAVLDMEASIEESKTQYLEVLKENTRRLNRISELQSSKKELEKRLNARQKTMAAPYTGQFFDASERQRLTSLVEYQAQEVEALKEEIQTLQLKGSHVLPPTHPPVPTGTHH